MFKKKIRNEIDMSQQSAAKICNVSQAHQYRSRLYLWLYLTEEARHCAAVHSGDA